MKLLLITVGVLLLGQCQAEVSTKKSPPSSVKGSTTSTTTTRKPLMHEKSKNKQEGEDNDIQAKRSLYGGFGGFSQGGLLGLNYGLGELNGMLTSGGLGYSTLTPSTGLAELSDSLGHTGSLGLLKTSSPLIYSGGFGHGGGLGLSSGLSGISGTDLGVKVEPLGYSFNIPGPSTSLRGISHDGAVNIQSFPGVLGSKGTVGIPGAGNVGSVGLGSSFRVIDDDVVSHGGFHSINDGGFAGSVGAVGIKDDDDFNIHGGPVISHGGSVGVNDGDFISHGGAIGIKDDDIIHGGHGGPYGGGVIGHGGSLGIKDNDFNIHGGTISVKDDDLIVHGGSLGPHGGSVIGHDGSIGAHGGGHSGHGRGVGIKGDGFISHSGSTGIHEGGFVGHSDGEFGIIDDDHFGAGHVGPAVVGSDEVLHSTTGGNRLSIVSAKGGYVGNMKDGSGVLDGGVISHGTVVDSGITKGGGFAGGVRDGPGGHVVGDSHVNSGLISGVSSDVGRVVEGHGIVHGGSHFGVDGGRGTASKQGPTQHSQIISVPPTQVISRGNSFGPTGIIHGGGHRVVSAGLGGGHFGAFGGAVSGGGKHSGAILGGSFSGHSTEVGGGVVVDDLDFKGPVRDSVTTKYTGPVGGLPGRVAAVRGDIGLGFGGHTALLEGGNSFSGPHLGLGGGQGKIQDSVEIIRGRPAGFVHDGSAGLAHGGSAGLVHGGSAGFVHGGSADSIHGGSVGLLHGSSAGLVHSGSAGLAHGGSSGLVHGGSAGLAHGGSADLIHGGSAGLVHGGSAGLVRDGSAGLVHGGSAGLVHGASAGLVHGGSTGLVHGGSAGLVHGGSAGLVHGGSAGLAHGGSSGLVHGGSADLIHGGSAGLVHGGSAGLSHGGSAGFVHGGSGGLVHGGSAGFGRGGIGYPGSLGRLRGVSHGRGGVSHGSALGHSSGLRHGGGGATSSVTFSLGGSNTHAAAAGPVTVGHRFAGPAQRPHPGRITYRG